LDHRITGTKVHPAALAGQFMAYSTQQVRLAAAGTAKSKQVFLPVNE